jgi:O-antigen/teichoic acid export membrane protein
MRRARAHASPIVTAGVVTGAQGYHGRVTGEAAGGAHEANDATRGSAIKLAAEVVSRGLGLLTTVVITRGLGVEGFGVFGGPFVVAVLLAELGELGLQTTASRALVAGSVSLRSLVRARLALLAVVGGLALAAAPVSPVLSPLVLFFLLSGWGEFAGVALRCRGGRVQEALLLCVLRGGGLVLAGAALQGGAGPRGVAWALATSPLPALGLGAAWLARRNPPASGPGLGVADVLRLSAPLAIHSGLLLLSPRVEYLVVAALLGDRERGLFLAALQVYWFLGMVPTAIAAGAMPSLTREAIAERGPVRQRTAGLLATLAAPAAVGLALVAPALVATVFGGGYRPAAPLLRVLAAGVPALFLNALATASLVAAGRAPVLPRITAARVAVAFAVAVVVVPRFGVLGAAAGLVAAEWLLLALGLRACDAASFEVRALRPVVWALVACVPMALAVNGVRESLPLAVAVGVLSWAATLAAVAKLRPGLARELVGGLR